MAQDLKITMLLDLYGAMLTEKQRDFLSLYYNEDLSLSEIADNEGITRQAVRDSIQRAQTQLLQIESKLGLYRVMGDIVEKAEALSDELDVLEDYNRFHGMSKPLAASIEKMRAIVNDMSQII